MVFTSGKVVARSLVIHRRIGNVADLAFEKKKHVSFCFRRTDSSVVTGWLLRLGTVMTTGSIPFKYLPI